MAGSQRFGVELHQYVESSTLLAEARLAEELGFESVWFGDSQLIWRELYVILGAAATVTSSVALGVGVTNPVTRHVSVTASAAATLHELSGGRAILGLGLGNTSVKTIGSPPATRAELAEYIATARRLLAGDTVPGSSSVMRLVYGAPATRIPIVIGAAGPRLLRFAGEIGDGVIISGQVCRPETLDALLAEVRAGRERADGPPRPFTTYVGVAAAVHSDRAAALAAVRPHVAQGLLAPSPALSAEARRAGDALRDAYDVSEHFHPDARHAAAVPDALIQEFAIAGTSSECREIVRRIFAAGVDEITIRPYAAEGQTRLDAIAAFAHHVMGA